MTIEERKNGLRRKRKENTIISWIQNIPSISLLIRKISVNLQYEQTSAIVRNNLNEDLPNSTFMAFKYDYNEERNSVEWQRKADVIRQRDNYTCQVCGAQDKQVHVHHTWYNPNLHYWDYPNKQLITLCKECHEKETVLTRQFKENKDRLDENTFGRLVAMMQDGWPLIKLQHLLNSIGGESMSRNTSLNPKASTSQLQRSINERKRAFVEELKKYEKNYDTDYIETFLSYWITEQQGILRFEHDATFMMRINLAKWKSEYNIILQRRDNEKKSKEIDDCVHQFEQVCLEKGVKLFDREISSGYGIEEDRLRGKFIHDRGLYSVKERHYDKFTSKSSYRTIYKPLSTRIASKISLNKQDFALLYEAYQAFPLIKQYNHQILSTLDNISYIQFCNQYGIKYSRSLKYDKSIKEWVNSQPFPCKLQYENGTIRICFPSYSNTYRPLINKLNEVFRLRLFVPEIHDSGCFPVCEELLYIMDEFQFDLRCDSFENGTMKSISLPSTFKDISYYIKEIEKIFQRH